MKAVNLIPGDVQRSGRQALRLAPITYGLFGVLAAALVLVVMFVLASNKVSTDQAQISSLQTQVNQAQAEAAQLNSYSHFASLAQTRVQTVRGIAATRFDWSTALGNVARVIPADTSLQSLAGTVVPNVSIGGGSGSGSGLRADLPGPAFDIVGCTRSQTEVATLISRLRAVPGVVRVALSSAVKPTGNAADAGVATPNGRGCPASDPVFTMSVFFSPVTGAGPSGALSTTATTGAVK